jgi:hypothetical protein
MPIFTSKEVWKFLIRIQLKKFDPKRTRGWKVPCLMPIRVSWHENSLILVVLGLHKSKNKTLIPKCDNSKF